MNRLTKTMTCGMLAAVLGVTSLTGCGKTLDGTKTVATCNGEKVSLGAASFLLRYTQAQMMSYYTMFGQSVSWDTLDEEKGMTLGESAKENMLSQLEDMMLLKEHAKDYDVSITEEEQKEIEESAKSFIEANTEETLKQLAVSQEDIETVLELFTIQNKMYDPMTADVDTEVSDEEAAQKKVTCVRVSTVGTETGEDGKPIALTGEEKEQKKEQAQQILDKIAASEDVAGADMDAIAKEVDENLSATTSSYGSDDTIVEDVIKNAAEGLEDGQLAPEVAEGENAYYVVRLDTNFDQEATDTKKSTIVSDRKQEAYQAKLEEWSKDAKFDVEKKVWDKLKVTDNNPFVFKQEPADTTGTEGTDENTENTDAPADTTDGQGTADSTESPEEAE